MNTFLQSANKLGKIFIMFLLAYLLTGIFFAQNKVQLIIGLFVLIFITLPTIYLLYFKKKFPQLNGVWKIYRIFYIIFIVAYVAFYFVGVWRADQQNKTQATIDFINSKKITMDDVMGKNLPPQPNQQLNDSTIAGIDANNNYIRDDVELAIFKEYPNSAKIRSAELQYAQEIQIKLTSVYDTNTWLAAMKKINNGISCMVDSAFNKFADTNSRIKQPQIWQGGIDTSQFNTRLRQEKIKKLETYSSAYVTGSGVCDIPISEMSD